MASALRRPPNGEPDVTINIVQWSAIPERRFAFVRVDGSQVTRLTTGNLRPHQIRWSTRTLGVDAGLIYFLDGSGAIRVARASGGDPVNVPFRVRMTINTQDEYTELFDQGAFFRAEFCF